MKLEAGKSYRTAGGQKATVGAVYQKPDYPYGFAVGYVDGADDYIHWHLDGSGPRDRCGGRLYKYEIVCPWVEPPQLVGLTAKVHADGKVEIDLEPLGLCSRHRLHLNGVACSECVVIAND